MPDAGNRAAQPPIDPLEGPKLALSGQIVTMDRAARVLPRGTIYIEHGGITAVTGAGEAPPPGFEAIPVVETGGTIFPGLIELHNHLSYNVLRLWQVPKKYGNRGQWAGTPEYQTLVSGPMGLLGRVPGLLPAVVRYVECKCLLGGVTTSQGVELFSNQGARRYYRGVVRNVEETGDPRLPEAATRIADVDAKDGQSFLARLGQKKCFLLHLAEGLDEAARSHFLSLEFEPGEWAIAPSLAGIHCAGLEPPDFDILARKGGSMIWSPLSNLLLYGGTARIEAARSAGVRMGIGSDWSPSGSKNLLGELKVAHLVSQEAGGILSDRDILALATTNAAAILHWDDRLGSLEAGKCADLFVQDGTPRDPYGALLRADESSVELVMINGVPRSGAPGVMKSLGARGEEIAIGGQKRILNLDQRTADPDVEAISLGDARTTLAKALHDLPNLKVPPAPREAGPGEPLVWRLALDELAPTGMDLRPHLPFLGQPTMADAKGEGLRAPPKLVPLELDPLTVVDDEAFLTAIAKEGNLPESIRKGLAELYGGNS